MKHNQFKKLIKQEIENQCDLLDFKSVYIDVTNTTREIYIYTLDYKYAGIFSFWFSDKQVHLCFSNLKTLSLVQHRVKDIYCKYYDIDLLLDTIQQCFDIMDKFENVGNDGK